MKNLALLLHCFVIAGFPLASVASETAATPLSSTTAELETEAGTCDGSNTCQEEGQYVDLIQPQIDWVRANGGFVNGNVEIRRKKDSNVVDPSRAPYGVFATAAIAKSETIFSIPKQCHISAAIGDDQVADGMHCGTVRSLIREFQLGNASAYAPYVNFLKNLPHGLLPSSWSPSGKKLLVDLLGSMLPPRDPVTWLENEWKQECGGSDDPMADHAAMLVVERDWNGHLVPLLDILNSRRGFWDNTDHNALDIDDDGVDEVVVKASRPISAGEEIFTDFNENTPDLLRDCGIVEPYPQVWDFRRQRISFSLNERRKTPGKLILKWHSPPMENLQQIEAFQKEKNRLAQFASSYLEVPPSDIPEHEWNTIVDYHEAVSLAISLALDESNIGHCSVSDDTCQAHVGRYSELNEEFDDSFHSTDTCDQQKELDHSHYKNLEEIKSPYQKIVFLEDPANKDMCFSLDGIYQICTKYRPHYHEPVVHYTARFLESVKRIIFIGGGDSMILHEALQYPSLEFVVGLEIDQKVTRNSFKYFGTQPHWDDDRVQWWYGDAAKSLLMLPKDYFGTFDMVLVDLSETIMSNTVTKGLDIMSALSLLLKPEGIFLKNEMYFENLSRVFHHTIQLHYYDVPLVCSQCLVLGSNKIDFIQKTLTDHKVHTMHRPVMEVDHDFELVHDYMTNPDFERYCKEDNDDEVPEYQERSPGVAMIVEAENTTAQLSTSDAVKSILLPALEAEGLNLVSAKSLDVEGHGPIVTMVLREGYVVARASPENNYCVFDIHMWSSFGKQESLKKSLLTAVGSSSQSSSSFRIAGGGMFGVSTWKEDDMSRGPKFTQDCDEMGSKQGGDISIGESSVRVVVEESIRSLQRHSKANAVVLCGAEGEHCSTLSALREHDGIGEVFPIWACPLSGTEDEFDEAKKMFNCEKDIYTMLAGKSIGTVIVDTTASRESAQIVQSLAKSAPDRNRLFLNDVMVLAISLQEEDWRRIFVDHFREFFDNEPGFKASVLFHNSERFLEMTTFSSGDKHFITHLKEAASNIEKYTGLTSDIRHVGGVEYEMQHNFKPSQFFNATDYDRTAPYEQWKTQQPTGYQNLFQLEINQKKNKDRTGLTCEGIRSLLDDAMHAINVESEPDEFLELGDGCVFVDSWNGGNFVVLFNGRDHVDINLFTYVEDSKLGQKFVKSFTKGSSLEKALHDEMPRGYGRVVNFKNEVEPRHEPRWAFAMD